MIKNYCSLSNNIVRAINCKGNYLYYIYLGHIQKASTLNKAQAITLINVVQEALPNATFCIGMDNPIHGLNLYDIVNSL